VTPYCRKNGVRLDPGLEDISESRSRSRRPDYCEIEYMVYGEQDAADSHVIEPEQIVCFEGPEDAHQVGVCSRINM